LDSQVKSSLVADERDVENHRNTLTNKSTEFGDFGLTVVEELQVATDVIYLLFVAGKKI
jgi:hypothetical protein